MFVHVRRRCELRPSLQICCLFLNRPGTEDYLIDALALGTSLSALAGVLSDPSICKVRARPPS